MTEAGSAPGGRYRVEFRRARQADVGWRWQPMMMFGDGDVPAPLRFHGLEAAHAYVATSVLRAALRIVLVDDEGGREVVG